jgi:hypothetical protein
MVRFSLTLRMTAPSAKQTTRRSNIIVEKGADPTRLIIAFTGFQGALNVPTFDFFSATGRSDASRILLRDPWQLLYLVGCWPDEPGLKRLLARLRREIASLGPRHITCVGTSSGGYAAMLFGHLLGVDRVHAFAPTVYGSAWVTLMHGDWEQFRKRVMPRHLLLELLMAPSTWRYRDLSRTLREWNGITEFTVHVCSQNEHDMSRVETFRALPHVDILAHPCSTHQVAKYLVRSGQLTSVFES